MGKFSPKKRLSRKEQEELFVDFAKALGAIHNAVEAASFIKDLLSEAEVIMLARRLQIARLLERGCTYEEIQKTMKVSNTTITKVQTWLDLYGEGYRTVLKRTKAPVKAEAASLPTWRNLKRKYPMYFWPELVLKEIVSSANSREKERLVKVLREMKEKTKLTRDLMQILTSSKSYHTQ
ncbi:MAG: hypothetical protein COT92_01555 [Candidatus Doudnabacteria bacterium CG10_big_fil_rev_8_21_14_0_10_42_18]|uniref:TrpR like protein, YerC/YecD n=1 Tax=Candidatus Doudnabacteria bacterium CG10_big_fil_rev_8_21_14_0_10_42_18 TaxID=1974552 RepID=A0A2H0VDB4_9BACT|nr:MAG: hypothetical protein COT92_01555 [Candidatus Doudnabacteria bacterium CG10_big_fil_rev_8_21_14_0_10_42_18]